MATNIQRWNDFFSLLDADQSGYLDPNDLKGAAAYYGGILHEAVDSPQIQAIVATQSQFLKQLINDYDANKDGKISKEEFIEAVKKVIIGKSADEVPGINHSSPFLAWWKESIQRAFEAGDINQNGSLSLEEIVASVQLMNPKASTDDIKTAFEWATAKSGMGKEKEKDKEQKRSEEKGEKKEEIKGRRKRLISSIGGKYDPAAHFLVSYTWATEPGPTPASILTPYFSKLN